MDVKLEIKISEDKKIKLTEEEAIELYEKLDELFGIQTTSDWMKDLPIYNPFQYDVVNVPLTNTNTPTGSSEYHPFFFGDGEHIKYKK